MNLELQAKLFQRHPMILRKAPVVTDPNDESRDSPIDYWGVECGDGWFDLLDSLLSQFDSHLDRLQMQGVPKSQWPRVCQIKEKFGTLRFYLKNTEELTPDLMQAIETTETKSAEICDVCGNSGELRTAGYLVVLCDSCFEAPDEGIVLDHDDMLASLRELLASRPA